MSEQLLKSTSDRKTRFYASQKNTFGLLPGIDGTCPGATTAPGGCAYRAPGRRTCTCYVDNLMHLYKGVKGVLAYNTALLRNAKTTESMCAILDSEFTRFEAAERKHAKKNGTEPHLFYRLHWSGDIFNDVYARALKDAMIMHPDIQFWGYTRSFSAVHVLTAVPNLILYLSLDPVNVLHGLVVYDEHNGPNSNLQLCYMSATNDFEDVKGRAREIIDARNAIRVLVGAPPRDTTWLDKLTLRECPVDTGKLPTEGGCPSCTSCLTPGTAPVWFKT